MTSFPAGVESGDQCLFNSDGLSCFLDVTILIKGVQNARFSFRIFTQDFRKLISLERKQILTNGKELSSWFLTVLHISQ